MHIHGSAWRPEVNLWCWQSSPSAFGGFSVFKSQTLIGTWSWAIMLGWMACKVRSTCVWLFNMGPGSI